MIRKTQKIALNLGLYDSKSHVLNYTLLLLNYSAFPNKAVSSIQLSPCYLGITGDFSKPMKSLPKGPVSCSYTMRAPHEPKKLTKITESQDLNVAFESGAVAHACRPSNMEAWDQKEHGSRPDQEKIVHKTPFQSIAECSDMHLSPQLQWETK
jgi:hypothetical protein